MQFLNNQLIISPAKESSTINLILKYKDLFLPSFPNISPENAWEKYIQFKHELSTLTLRLSTYRSLSNEFEVSANTLNNGLLKLTYLAMSLDLKYPLIEFILLHREQADKMMFDWIIRSLLLSTHRHCTSFLHSKWIINKKETLEGKRLIDLCYKIIGLIDDI